MSQVRDDYRMNLTSDPRVFDRFMQLQGEYQDLLQSREQLNVELQDARELASLAGHEGWKALRRLLEAKLEECKTLLLSAQWPDSFAIQIRGQVINEVLSDIVTAPDIAEQKLRDLEDANSRIETTNADLEMERRLSGQ